MPTATQTPMAALGLGPPIRRRPSRRRGWPSAYRWRRFTPLSALANGPRGILIRRRPVYAEGGRRHTGYYVEGNPTPMGSFASYPGGALRRRQRHLAVGVGISRRLLPHSCSVLCVCTTPLRPFVSPTWGLLVELVEQRRRPPTTVLDCSLVRQHSPIKAQARAAQNLTWCYWRERWMRICDGEVGPRTATALDSHACRRELPCVNW
jgi:hypothetical protein